MRFGYLSTLALALFPLAIAQSSSPTSGSLAPSASSNSTRSNSTQQVITTTITSLTPGPSGSSSGTTFLTLTLTLNSSQPTNTTLNGTAVADNSTLSGNATEAWTEGDDWIPFHIRIDPAYGVLGGLLIISGIPVALLGGKNKWSSLAVVSGYSVMLFTLVMILRFGVEDNLQPPSPNPPNTTLRGLYLLACLIAAAIGAGIGIFFFNIAKYFVAAAGGFAFGWYLLEVKSGGLITSIPGRWALLGGLTVVTLLGSIVPNMVDHMMLASTAWIGATAFVLGVDCFTRAGLKEFYVYNLGFHDLFPKLDGAKYPLTQTMMIELGILAAVVLIGAAIQARVLGQIQKRLKQAREEEEAQIEAEEVSRAAERFKNVGSELAAWDEKHGSGKGMVGSDHDSGPSLHDAPTSQLPTLSHDQPNHQRRGPSPSLPPVGTDGRGLYEELPLASPPMRGSGLTPLSSHFDVEELKDDSTPEHVAGPASPAFTDPELEGKLKLLEEVKKARESIRGSIDELRRQTPTPSLGGRLDAGSRSETPAYSMNGRKDGRPVSEAMSRMSTGSRMLDEFDARDRRISTASSYMLGAPNEQNGRAGSSSSRLLDITNDTPRVNSPEESGSARLRHYSDASSQLLDATRGGPTSNASSPTEWDRYVSDRQILAPPAPSHSQSQYMLDRRDKTSSMVDLSAPIMPRSASHDDRRSRTTSMIDNPYNQYNSLPPAHSRQASGRDSTYAPGVIIGSASNRDSSSNSRRPMQHRSMTYEELADRHRQRISALQNPVSSQMKEEEDVRIAREKWERQKKRERAEMQQKEQSTDPARIAQRSQARAHEKQEVLKSTDEWRRSVHTGLDGFGRAAHPQGGGSMAGGGADASRRGRDKRISTLIN